MSGNCLVCTPRRCEPYWLYVVEDTRDGTVKIGLTIDVSRRIASYRANRAVHLELRHKRIAGCEFTGADREQKALRALAKLGPRRAGDFFHATVADAIQCVEKVCAGYQGAKWQ